METSASKPKSLLDLAKSVAKDINPDMDLTRYSLHRFKSHIKACCASLHYIEAYTLTLQYVEDLFYFFADENKKLFQTDTPKILSILSGLKIINSELYVLFSDINDQRNMLAHKVIRENYKTARKNFGKVKPEVHEKKLSKLIELAESEFVSLVKKYPHKFQFSKKTKSIERDRVMLLGNIIMEKVFTELQIPEDIRGKKDQIMEFYRKAYFARFKKEVLGYIYPDLDISP